MQSFIRNLINLFAIAGLSIEIIYGTMALLGGSGMTDESHSAKVILINAAVWVLPAIAFVFMFLDSQNRLRGIWYRIGCWYTLIFLTAAGAFLIFFHHIHPRIGLIFLMMAGLVGVSFRINNRRASRDILPVGSPDSTPASAEIMSDAMPVLIGAAWLPPFIALPLYFLAGLGAGLSAGVPHVDFGEVFVLAVGPLISLVAAAMALRKRKAPVWKLAILCIPVLLSLAELAFAFELYQP